MKIDFKTGYAKYLTNKFIVNVVVKDNAYKPSKKGLKSFGGGKARTISNSSKKGSRIGLFRLTKILEGKYKFLSKPVRKVNVFTKQFWNSVFTAKDINRVNNSYKSLILQAINNRKYGRNKPSTIKRKGFDRKLIDTGQTLQAIKVQVRGNK